MSTAAGEYRLWPAILCSFASGLQSAAALVTGRATMVLPAFSPGA